MKPTTARQPDSKRVDCTASVYGLLVALGVAPFALAPLAPPTPDGQPLVVKVLAKVAGKDVPATPGASP